MNAEQRSNLFDLFCSEPYRLFFPLGVLIGVIGIGHWLIYSLGWITSYSGLFHASIQMEGYMACFVIGFLATAIPRFSNTPHATLTEVLNFFLLTCAISFFLFRYLWIPAEACFIGLLLALARFVIIRIKERKQGEGNSKGAPPLEFVWIPIAILHGITGSVILILYQVKLAPLWMGDIGEDMAFQGFILSIVAGVGGFLAPRLMGRFAPPPTVLPQSGISAQSRGAFGATAGGGIEMVKPSEVCASEELVLKRKRNLAIHLLLGFLFFTSFWLDIPNYQTLANGLRALVVTSALVWTRALPLPPRTNDFFVKLLWIAVWMVPLGLWLASFFPAHEKGMLHFTFIGGLSLMTFSIATMVILSHGGESAKLRRPLFILWVVLLGVILTLFFRIAAGFYPTRFFLYLAAASSIWIFVGMSWLCFIAPRIFQTPHEGTFEREHEEMKRRAAKV